jgi:uncharacterized protein YbjT (DUF2867 family)
MIVTVLGATGGLGRELVPRLVEAGFSVRAVVRREEQVPSVERPGVTAVLGDVEGGRHGDLAASFEGADAVVWSVGASRHDPAGHPQRIRDGGVRAVAAAEQAGVGRWIQISSMYANRAEQAPPPLVASMRDKYVVDQAVQASTLPWTIVRPGGLSQVQELGRVEVGAALAPGMIGRADVAAVVVELLRTGRGIGAEFDLVNDVATSVAEAVASL